MIYKSHHKKWIEIIVDRTKLNELFQIRKGRENLDFNRRDKDYIEAVRVNNILVFSREDFK